MSYSSRRHVQKRSAGKVVLVVLVLLSLCAVAALAAFLAVELSTSRLQSRYLARFSKDLSFQLAEGPTTAVHYPEYGSYDIRMGYTRMPDFMKALVADGFVIDQQARFSPQLLDLSRQGLFPAYHEKIKGGLTILGCDEEELFTASFPERLYADFDAIPRILVDSLLFIENRELLSSPYPTNNPAIEWGRLAQALLDKAIQFYKPQHDVPGGSTLATQIEKYRHSPEGLTRTVKDKLLQMASASLRVYLDGEDTTKARRRIVYEYINTVPLSAVNGIGEINGIGDGMWGWYGVEFDRLNSALRADEAGEGLVAKAWMFKHALSLIIAQRRPSGFLLGDPAPLDEQTNAHLRLLAREGIISPVLRDAAVQVKLGFATARPAKEKDSFVERKAASAVRLRIAQKLGIARFYDLDRLDLTVSSTLHKSTQKSVTEFLLQLKDPEFLSQNNLAGPRMLASGDPAKVIYSLNLYELGPEGTMLRVQADNLDQPFDINLGTKLDLGSTAKLRTLISYLEIIAGLHEQYANLDDHALRGLEIGPNDRLSRWAVDYIATTKDRGLAVMLDAALERTYSANPGETFYTAGGNHTFSNFSKEDNNRILSVRMAMRHSVNLVLIRMMRDIVHHYMYKVPGSTARVLANMDNPKRREYLERFADQEGKVFLLRFYHKYRGKTPEQILETMVATMRPTPRRLASIHRYLLPGASLAEFIDFLKIHVPTVEATGAKTLQGYYDTYTSGRFSLADQGYLAQLHPLELWLASYLRSHQQADWQEIVEASAKQRLEVYSWLMRNNRKNAQDRRIRSLIEVEAFLEIHKDWKRLGYPFASLVPSYATSIGSSADRPAALADLMAILVNDGVRPPSAVLSAMHFAAGTPYETVLSRKPATGERLLPSEVASAARAVLRDIVEHGTAIRINHALVRPDGSEIPIGGKTGTGDHRYVTYKAGGVVKDSRVVNRSATFVFYIGDRFYGTLTAFVPGVNAANYEFTSSLPVSILKLLLPRLAPLVMPEPGQAACLSR